MNTGRLLAARHHVPMFMMKNSSSSSLPNGDLSALSAAGTEGVALCTIVNIEGSFSRRMGAQLAVTRDGLTIGSLSDGCLEMQLATEVGKARGRQEKRLLRFGRGSPFIDFRLPCGSGLDILVDPAPDVRSILLALDRLERRMETALDLPLPLDAPVEFLRIRHYVPPLRIMLFGEGPELASLVTMASAIGIDVQSFDKQSNDMALGRVPGEIAADPWTAIILLFHDHEWERALLGWAMRTSAFYIGAQGGARAREDRVTGLQRQGFAQDAIERVRSPIGLIRHARDPVVLTLSVLAEIVAEYEARHPHM